jgi:hypothetical protein
MVKATKTDCHDIAEILLKVTLKHQKSNQSIGGVMFRVVASSALDCGLEPRYIMATSFSGGRSRSTRREPLTVGKQLVNLITYCCESSAPFL